MTLNGSCIENTAVTGLKQALDRELHCHRSVRSRSRIDCDGRELVNFGSNDYLGLAVDPRILAAVIDAVGRYGWGASASSSLGGRTSVHVELEQRLARFVDAEAALLFSSGYAANLDAIRTLVSEGDAIYCDEQNHSSLLDAALLSGAVVQIYRHSDCDHLSTLLKDGRQCRRRLIASESLFGSDGSVAPLRDLAEVADRHDAKLLVDESHAVGTFGDQGQGAAAFLRSRGCLAARVGTLGKALGGVGGFVAGPASFIASLTEQARGYQHSTALPTAVCAGAIAALNIAEAESCRREALTDRAAEVRASLLDQGWNVHSSVSHIIPVMFEELARAESTASALQDAGYFLPCVTSTRGAAVYALLRLRIGYSQDPWMIQGLLSNFSKLI
jgi:8-amino-7-oxononanoate synthase